MRGLAFLVLCGALGTPAFAQTAPAPTRRATCSPGTLSGLIECAYGINWYQLDGPWWITKFEPAAIEARIPEELQYEAPPETVRRVLAEKLGLKAHREMRTDDVYVLRVHEGGPKIRESCDTKSNRGASSRAPSDAPRTLCAEYKKTTMAQLALNLSRSVKRPVLDETGLAAEYDFTMDEDLLAASGIDDGGIPALIPDWILSSLAKLGLWLDERRAPIEHLVIDNIELP